MSQIPSDIASLSNAMGKPDFRYHSFDNVALIPQTPYVTPAENEAEHAEPLGQSPDLATALPHAVTSKADAVLTKENSLTDVGSIQLSRVFAILDRNGSTGVTPAKKLNEIFR
ncbi:MULTISPECIES: hypothetical protein [Gluconobacter]|uniref:hypothetical protein n=1 Tax=Gluconobacter TaxID=441 RepID=UPI001C050AFF|nr:MULTISPECIES: hypothetical protein [Gluconobacter]